MLLAGFRQTSFKYYLQDSVSGHLFDCYAHQTMSISSYKPRSFQTSPKFPFLMSKRKCKQEKRTKFLVLLLPGFIQRGEWNSLICLAEGSTEILWNFMKFMFFMSTTLFMSFQQLVDRKTLLSVLEEKQKKQSEQRTNKNRNKKRLSCFANYSTASERKESNNKKQKAFRACTIAECQAIRLMNSVHISCRKWRLD